MTNILELAAAHKALATALEKVHAAEQRIIKASAPTEEPTPEPTPADEPRYSAVRVNGAWGVADREHPEVWSYWGAYSNAEEYTRRWVGYLNEGARSRNSLDWSTDGMSTDN